MLRSGRLSDIRTLVDDAIASFLGGSECCYDRLDVGIVLNIVVSVRPAAPRCISELPEPDSV